MTADDILDFIHDLRWQTLSADIQQIAVLNMLDLIGIGAGGAQTKLSHIIRDHAVEAFGGSVPMLFDGRTVSAAGMALAGGMTVDSLDGHDGYNAAKGHIGCPLIPALLALAQVHRSSGKALLEAIVVGYEIGARVSVAQHATVPDYHTSGSWGAVAAAAAGARLAGLTREETRHAMGIAEYHGPRSQMMRCIDHPTMLKDGSGWGSMSGVSAVQLAARGFTGAPAITVEEAPGHWDTLGADWTILHQYYKPYPVCRWAQGPIEALLTLRTEHALRAENVTKIEIESFHEATRLAINDPRNTEEAQYSTSFPCAIAMVHGDVLPEHLADDALNDAEIRRLSQCMVMREHDYANEGFPQKRFARVAVTLSDGRYLESDWHIPRWDPAAPATAPELRKKYHRLAGPLLGETRAKGIEAALDALPETGLDPLMGLITQPISRATTSGSSS